MIKWWPDDSQTMVRWWPDDVEMMIRWWPDDSHTMKKRWSDDDQIKFRWWSDQMISQTMTKRWSDYDQIMFKSWPDHDQLNSSPGMPARWKTQHGPPLQQQFGTPRIGGKVTFSVEYWCNGYGGFVEDSFSRVLLYERWRRKIPFSFF